MIKKVELEFAKNNFKKIYRTNHIDNFIKKNQLMTVYFHNCDYAFGQ